MSLFDRIKKEKTPEVKPEEMEEKLSSNPSSRGYKEIQLEAIAHEYPMPDPREYNFYSLDPLGKRKMTICNLFANHQKSIPEIIELLGCSRKLVVDTLVENKLVKDRRQVNRPKTPSPEESGKKRI
jgi:hypothetical protein